MPIKITADSACDLSSELLEKYDITILSLYVTMSNGEAFQDHVDAFPADVFKNVSVYGKIPKTSAPNVQDYIDVFSSYIDQGYEIVHLSLNSVFSSSFQNACLASQQLENVFVFDTKAVSASIGLLAIKAAEMAQAGKSAIRIYQELFKLRDKMKPMFMLDSLDYAVKGGRCSILTAFGANLLKLKPCLALDDQGQMHVAKKFRGTFASAALDYVKHVLSAPNIDYSRLYICYTEIQKGTLDLILNFVEGIKKFSEVLVSQTGCVIATHGGPNTLALFYMTN